MRGITEERLMAYDEMCSGKDASVIDVLNDLINNCSELNPWLPIDKHTPKDREVVLFWSEHIEFNLKTNKQIAVCSDAYLNHCIIKPTHYCELPENPKC